MDRLREKFDALDAAAIESMIQCRQQEGLHLDFKILTSPFRNKDDRRSLAKALSGFANSDGGIVIWGVDGRKGADGVDCATEPVPVERLAEAMSNFNSLLSDTVSPDVDGAESKPIPTSRDRGFLVTIIPKSDSGPHLARAGEHRYFKRVGDSFVKMEHYELEDMFGRRPRPLLRPTMKVRAGGHGTAGVSYSITLGVENWGRGSARAPLFSLCVFPPHKLDVDRQTRYGLPLATSLSDDKFCHFGGTMERVVHPSTSLEVVTIRDRYPQPRTIHEPAPQDPLRALVRLAADGFPLQEFEIVVTPEQILDASLRPVAGDEFVDAMLDHRRRLRNSTK